LNLWSSRSGNQKLGFSPLPDPENATTPEIEPSQNNVFRNIEGANAVSCFWKQLNLFENDIHGCTSLGSDSDTDRRYTQTSLPTAPPFAATIETMCHAEGASKVN
jgi:hypothetical protein